MASPMPRSTYQKTAGFAKTDGQDFEVHLSALLFLRGLNSGLDFQLASNVKGAGALDDLVFRFKSKQEAGTWTTMFVQLKHKDKPNVTRKLLLKDAKKHQSGFLLTVYFKAYLEIKQAMAKEEREVLFDGGFENSWYVLFTNANAYKDLGAGRTGNFSEGEEFVWTGRGSVLSFDAAKDKDILDSLLKLKLCEVNSLGECDEIGKFLKRLRMFCGQSNVSELKEEIEKELIKLNERMSYRIDIGELLENFLNNAKIWCETSNDILSKDHDLLLQAVENVRFDSARLLTQTKYWYKSLVFEDRTLAPLRGFLAGESLVACVESSEGSSRLSVTKLMLAVGDRALVLTCQDLLANTQALLLQWRNRAYNSLVICSDDQSLKQFETYLEVVRNLVAIRGTYRIVFLSRQISRVLKPLAVAFQRSIDSFNDSFLFSQLREGSRKDVLAKGVTLQGRETTLSEMLGASLDRSTYTVLDTVLDACSAQEVLGCEGSLLVGSIPSEGVDYYVDRSLEQASVVKTSLLQEGVLRENVTIRVMQCGSAVDCPGQVRLTAKVSGYQKGSNDHVNTGLVKKAIRFLSILKDSSAILYVNEVDVVSKLSQSPLEPDEADGAVFVGRKVPLGQFQCNWVGLRFGKIDAVTALRVGSSKAGSQQACLLFVTDEVIDEDVRKLSDFHASKHSLSLEDETLRWVESRGDIEMIRPHIDEDRITRLVPEKATDVEDRLLLVCAEPGMGKTTLMARLAASTKEALPHYFVLSVALSDHSQLFAQNKHEDAVDFLTKATKLESPLSRSLLKHALEVSGNVVVLLDGFDEIAPRYVKECCDLLSNILTTKATKVWLTARNSLKKKLETQFSRLSSKLSQFDLQDMKHFLKSFWVEKSVLCLEELEAFIDELLEKTSQAVRDKDKNLMGIPLQTRMLAEVYEAHVTGSPDKVALPANLDLLLLMEQFVDRKCTVYVEEKIKILSFSPFYDDTFKKLKKVFLESHSIAALSLLLADDDFKSLDMVEPLKEFLKDVSEGTDKTGFIDGVVNDKPRFVHRVFAEYFAARWISEHFEKHPKMVQSKLFADDFTVVRDILDRILAKKLDLDAASKNRDLHNAVLREDLEEVIRLLEHDGGLVEVQDGGGRTALHLAAGRGTSENQEENRTRVKILEVLMGKPGDIDRVDKVFGWTPPQYADATRTWAAIDRFLRLDADRQRFPLTADDTTDRGMLEAVFDLDLSCLLSFCLDNGLAVEYRREGANRLLLRACEKGSCEALKILVERNADINHIMEENSSARETERIPLHVASKMGHVNVVNILVEKFINSTNGNLRRQNICGDTTSKDIPIGSEYVNVKDNNGVTAMHAAAAHGHSDVINLLVTSGGDPLSLDCDKNSPLHLAAKYRHPGVVSLLLDVLPKADRAAAVDSRDGDGKSALHHAALAGCLECVELLVQAGGAMGQGSDAVQTPLAAAAQLGHLNVVRYLLENFNALQEGMSKLDYIKMTVEDGKTAIHSAASNGHSTVISFLIDQGGDPQTTARDMSTPIHLAARNKHPGAVKVLLGAVNEAGRAAAVNSCDKDGNSVLICGALGGCVECVEVLVQAGGKMSLANNVGNTALLSAAFRGNHKVFTYLLKSFKTEREDNLSMADFIHTTDSFALDAIHYAASNGLTEDISFMISQGGCLQEGGYFFQTPFHLAALYKHPSTLKVLLESLESLDDIQRDQVVNLEDFFGETALTFAAEGGWVECVQLLVQAGAKLSQANHARNTPLIVAASRGHLDVVTHLLNTFNPLKEGMNKLEYNKKLGEGGLSALHRAAQGDHSQVISVLISHGGDPLGLSGSKSTPLHIAAKNKSPNALRVLLEAVDEADRVAVVNTCDDSGNSVWTYGVVGGCVEVVELLIWTGGSFQQVDNAGNTPFMLAVEHGNHEVVRLLLNNFNAATEGMLEKDYINNTDPNGSTAIHMAASKGNLHVMNLLIVRGGDPLSPDRNDITPLHLAAANRHAGAVGVLLDALDEADRAAAVNSRDKGGQTALHHAAVGGCLDCVELLVQAGGTWSCVDHFGKTPLMTAAEHGYGGVVESFLLKRINSETENMSLQDCCNSVALDGKTAVYLAASGGHTDVVRVLLSQGGDPLTSARDHSTPLQSAVKNNHLSTAKALLAAVDESDRAAAVNSCDNDGNSALYYATVGDCVESFELLVQTGGKLSLVNCTGQTLLMAAAGSGNQKFVVYLLENFKAERYGISTLADYIDLADDDGNTAIHYAARSNHSVAISSLITQGGDSRAKNKRGSTPLHAAAESKRHKAVKVLLEAVDKAERAAAVNSCDNNGNSALICGARGGCYKCVRDLVHAGGKLTQANHDGITPLMAVLAAEFDHLKLVKFMLNNFDATRDGMSKQEFVNFADVQGCTVFHHCAQKEVDSGIFNFLVKLGGDPQRRDRHNRSPLHLAAECAQWNLVDTLLKLERADAVNSCDDRGDSVLTCGARGGCVDIVELLVRAGGKLTHVNPVTLMTPLMEAAVNRHAAVTRFLLDVFDAKAESLGKLNFIHMTDKDGMTAWALADLESRKVIEECLIEFQ